MYHKRSQKCYDDETELNLSEAARKYHQIDEPLKMQTFFNHCVLTKRFCIV